MEIPNQPIQGPRPNRRSQNEQPIDITRLNREAIQRSTEEFQHAAVFRGQHPAVPGRTSAGR